MVARNNGRDLLTVSLILTLALFRMAEANSDGDALYALRQSLSDPQRALESWDPTLVDPCTWFHITCNGDNRVTRVDLGSYQLSGHLVPDLGKLDQLQYLELYENDIQGTIPSELGNLKSLISFDLYKNSLTGQIPPSLGNLKSLLYLRLNNNHLTGSVPPEVTSLPNLRVLDVSGNNVPPLKRIPMHKFENNAGLKGRILRAERS
ncbi:unnamed protein product [Microthlaspi erraticum]|uniref:Uncharacterized protein n=1 Tax=Microthlaspi erraticum TaxID=1685480 RepID=A0A6D2K0T2_9BRAS|nr:unnamed protein product [Microthlaspi erraticum]